MHCWQFQSDHISTQYHTALILVHRNFPTRTQDQSSFPHSGFTDLSTLSRNVCVNSAIRISDIISSYRMRHSLQRIFVTGLQHVGTAATALMAEISMLQGSKSVHQRGKLLDCLSELSRDMRTMSETYQPAVLMANVVGHFLRDSNDGSTTYSVPPSAQARDHTVPHSTQVNEDSEGAPSSEASRGFPLNFTDPVSSRGTTIPVGTQPALIDISGGLPSLPSSWFEDIDWEEDNEFLSLMGLKHMHGVSSRVGEGLEYGFELVGEVSGRALA